MVDESRLPYCPPKPEIIVRLSPGARERVSEIIEAMQAMGDTSQVGTDIESLLLFHDQYHGLTGEGG